MAKKPLFSVIIPTYNRQDFLRISIDSVLEQTSNDYELLVIDDGSTDATKEFVNEYQNSKLRYLYQRHQGVSRARNEGLKNSSGEFIAFLDSDDRFRKDKLEITSSYIKKHPEYKIFHTEEIWYRKGQLLPQKARHKKPTLSVFPDALKLCCISPSTAVIHKSIFQSLGHFDELLPVCEDYDFWLRATSQHPVFLIPEYLTIKEGGHPDQQSKKYPAMDKFRLYALEKLLKSGTLNAQMSALAYQEFKTKCSIYLKGARKRNNLEEVNCYTKLLNKLSNLYA